MLMISFIFNKTNFSNLFLDLGWRGLAISIFSPSGNPILLGGVGWRLRCGPFAVVYHNLMRHYLVAAAISSR
jgi:hypothetical protein